MDAVQLPLSDDTYNVVIDKGTIDCVLCDKEPIARVHKICERVSKVLLPGGSFIVYSLGNPEDRKPCFHDERFGWDLKTYYINKPSLEELRTGNQQEYIPREIVTWALEEIDEDKVHFIYVMQKKKKNRRR